MATTTLTSYNKLTPDPSIMQQTYGPGYCVACGCYSIGYSCRMCQRPLWFPHARFHSRALSYTGSRVFCRRVGEYLPARYQVLILINCCLAFETVEIELYQHLQPLYKPWIDEPWFGETSILPPTYTYPLGQVVYHLYDLPLLTHMDCIHIFTRVQDIQPMQADTIDIRPFDYPRESIAHGNWLFVPSRTDRRERGAWEGEAICLKEIGVFLLEDYTEYSPLWRFIVEDTAPYANAVRAILFRNL